MRPNVPTNCLSAQGKKDLTAATDYHLVVYGRDYTHKNSGRGLAAAFIALTS